MSEDTSKQQLLSSVPHDDTSCSHQQDVIVPSTTELLSQPEAISAQIPDVNISQPTLQAVELLISSPVSNEQPHSSPKGEQGVQVEQQQETLVAAKTEDLPMDDVSKRDPQLNSTGHQNEEPPTLSDIRSNASTDVSPAVNGSIDA